MRQPGQHDYDGADRLARLAALHVEELRRLAPQLEALWDGLDDRRR
jgi:hypothetical protein